MPSRGTMGIRMTRIRVDGTLAQTKAWRSHYTLDAAYRKDYDGTMHSTNSTAFVDILTFGLPTGYASGSNFGFEWYTIGDAAGGNSITQVLRNGAVVAGPYSRDSSGYQRITTVVNADPNDVIKLQMRRDGAAGPWNVYLTSIGLYAWDEAVIEMTPVAGSWY